MKNFLSKIIGSFKKRSLLANLLRVSLWGGSLMLLISLIVYLIIYFTLPSKEELKDIQNYTSSEVYSQDGVLLGKYFIQDRTNIEFKDLPEGLVQALIATEDVRFYKHHGVDFKGMLRVLFKSILLQDESSGGGSTLSQQLAKNLFPRKKYWMFSMPINKLREMILANKMEKVFTKNEILTLYLNTVPFGENAYGISTASKRFFNKTPNKLTIEEAAVLTGMLKATTAYNPRKNKERSQERRNVVIGQMEKYKYISSHVADSLKALPLKVRYNFSTHDQGLATYFREHVRLDLQKWLSEHPKPDGSTYNLYTDGLKIYTTIDSRIQKYAEEAVKQHISELQKSFYEHWGKKKPWGKNNDVVEKAIQRSERYISLKEQGYSQESIEEVFRTPVKMKIFTYKGEVEKTMSPLDSIKYYLQFLHPGFMAMETETGHIKAWVGGINFKYFKYDHVNEHAKRQVGSIFKPIVYAEALQQKVSPCEYMENTQTTYVDYENWTPRNSDNKYGGSYSMQGALTNSVNTISAQLIMKSGINNTIELAKKMGIDAPLDPVPSLALGTADVSLYEMVGAYNVFANRGVYSEPSMVLKVTDSKGNIIFELKKNQDKHRAMSEENADIMVKMLQNVVNNGTGSRLRYKYGIEGDVAGKTGTSQQHGDGWFIGFTPKLVAGAWVGAEDRRIGFRTIDLGQGASMALPIWGIFMNKVNKDPRFKAYQKATFPAPSEEVIGKLACADFIAPDTTENDNDSPWWWPFGKKDNDTVTLMKKTSAPRDINRSEKKNPFEKFKGLFKKKR